MQYYLQYITDAYLYTILHSFPPRQSHAYIPPHFQLAECPFFLCLSHAQVGISPYGIVIPPWQSYPYIPPHFQLAVFPFSAQVGIPPYGIVIDVGGFFWNEFMSMLAASILLSGQYGQFRCGVWGYEARCEGRRALSVGEGGGGAVASILMSGQYGQFRCGGRGGMKV